MHHTQITNDRHAFSEKKLHCTEVATCGRFYVPLLQQWVRAWTKNRWNNGVEGGEFWEVEWGMIGHPSLPIGVMQKKIEVSYSFLRRVCFTPWSQVLPAVCSYRPREAGRQGHRLPDVALQREGSQLLEKSSLGFVKVAFKKICMSKGQRKKVQFQFLWSQCSKEREVSAWHPV